MQSSMLITTTFEAWGHHWRKAAMHVTMLLMRTDQSAFLNTQLQPCIFSRWDDKPLEGLQRKHMRHRDHLRAALMEVVWHRQDY